MSFRGWPAEAFDFYAGLEADNSKAYWQANKDVYERAVREPFAALSAAVTERYGPLHLFRPYRDVRFSADKTPYKTAAGAVTEGEGGATYYVQLSAEGLFVGSGMYHLASDQLARYRDAVVDDGTGAVIAAVCADLEGRGWSIAAMDALKTAPRGYPKDHPRAALLRLKGLTAGRSFVRAKWMHSPGALARVTDAWDAVGELNGWLEAHVGPSTLPPPDLLL